MAEDSSGFQNYDTLLQGLADARNTEEAALEGVAATKAKSDDMAKTVGEAKDAFSIHSIGSAFRKGMTDKAKEKFDEAFQSAKDKLSEIKEGAGKSVEELGEENSGILEQGASRLTQFTAKVADGSTSIFEPAATGAAGAGAGAGGGAAGAGGSAIDGAAGAAANDVSVRVVGYQIAKPLGEEGGEEMGTFATGAPASQAEAMAQSFANTTADLGIQGLNDGSIRVGQQAGTRVAQVLKSEFGDEDMGEVASGAKYSMETGLTTDETATIASNTASIAQGGTSGVISEVGLAAQRIGSGTSSIAETLNAAKTAGGDALETATAGITKDLAIQAGKEAIGESISAGLAAIPGIDIFGAVAGIAMAAIFGHKEHKEIMHEGPNENPVTGGSVTSQIGI